MKDINTIILKLGRRCNFDCVYCSQEHLNKKEEEKDISSSLFSFLDKHMNKNITIKLYGGEPLLYKKQIRKIIESYKHTFNYMMISNGSLLTYEDVLLFNEYKVRFLLSHDGYNTKKTRGKNVLKSKRFKQIASLLGNNLEFLSVVSKENPRIDILYDYFREQGFEDTKVNLVWFKDNGTEGQRKLSAIDFEEFKKGIRCVLIRALLQLEGLSDEYINERNFFYSYAKRICEGVTHTHKCSSCGYYQGMNKIVVDTQGNIYDCQNQDNIIGNLKEDITKEDKIIPSDNILDCSVCPHTGYCEKICPYLSDKGKVLWCSIYKIVYEEILTIVKEKERK